MAILRKADAPKPRLAVVESDAPNAFTTGRNADHALVAVTTGIFPILIARQMSPRPAETNVWRAE